MRRKVCLCVIVACGLLSIAGSVLSLHPPSAVAQAVTPTLSPEAVANATFHTVQRGDNVFRLAQQYNTTMELIIAVNGLTNPRRIQVGQVLIIPLEGYPTPIPTATFTPMPTHTPAPTTTPIPPTLTPTFDPTVSYLLTTAPTIDPNPPAVATLAPDIPAAQDLPPTFTPPPTPLPGLPDNINGIPLDQILPLPPNVIANAQIIFANGQALGNNARAFSKLGDSTIESPFFMDRFDQPGGYHLGDFAALETTIEWFRGSFARDSVAVRVGLHSWSIFDSMWSDRRCAPAETLIACEFRLNRPSILFIRLGSNDVGVPRYFERSLREIVQYSIDHGVIPVLGTKPDRHEGSNINNEIIRQIAYDMSIPLWDFDLLAGTIPGRGLLGDGVHMNTFYAHDWRLSQGFQTGHGVHSLSGLIVLDRLLRTVIVP